MKGDGAVSEFVPPTDLDPECLALVLAMDRMLCITPASSCCGHGRDTFSIHFWVDDMETLPDFLYWIHPCHSGLPPWQVIVRTDCAKQPPIWCLESTSIGEEAYKEADEIARLLMEHEVNRTGPDQEKD